MDMSRDAALALMTREAFQQQTEATEKWRRASLSQVQLTSYFNGYTEISALRDEMRTRQGKSHFRRNRSPRLLNDLSEMHEVDKTQVKRIRKLAPYLNQK